MIYLQAAINIYVFVAEWVLIGAVKGAELLEHVGLESSERWFILTPYCITVGQIP